jgi:ribosomal protein S18 acetylase RimI-like enzyme
LKVLVWWLQVVLSDPDDALFLATHDEQVIGLVGARIGFALEFDQPYVGVTGLPVDETFRQRGVGTDVDAQR